jgi:hypothetical protein
MRPMRYYGECRNSARNPAMLNPFIIDQIKRREQEERHRQHREAVIELPVPMPAAPRPARSEDDADDESAERGVCIIDLL